MGVDQPEIQPRRHTLTTSVISQFPSVCSVATTRRDQMVCRIPDP